ncbi:MAG: chemotaxis protein CheW [Candidatus Aminicenantes bacterium]|nr:chemotaxis protein CheW [Candidatus Aminicenantes bacterium]
MDKNKWQEMQRRIKEAGEKLALGMTMSRETRRQILAQRARQLAFTEIKQEQKGPPLEVVEFRLADETYALECRFIGEVYPLKALTPIPGAPAFVLGIIDIRGRIVSIIDLKRFFELPGKGLSDLARVIVLRDGDGGMEFGILAEEVLGVTSIPAGEIQPPPPTLTGIRAEYLEGVAKNRLIVLDAAKLLTDEKIVVNQEMEI